MAIRSIRRAPVPPHLRTKFWTFLAGVDTLRRTQEADAVAPTFDITELQRLQADSHAGGDHPLAVAGEIFRDVDRSMPWHPLFAADKGARFSRGDMAVVHVVSHLTTGRLDTDGQAALFDALRAFAAAHIDVGYCQGMNYVAGAFIAAHAASRRPRTGADADADAALPLPPNTPEVVYWLLACLRKRYHMRQVWGPGVARLR